MKLQRTLWIIAACVLGAWMFRNYRLSARRNLTGMALSLSPTAAAGQVPAMVTRIVISPDGTLAIAGTRNGYTNVWNLKTGQQVFNTSLVAGCRVRSLAFNPATRQIFISGCKNQVQVDNLDTAASRTLSVPGITTQISMQAGAPFSVFHSYIVPPAPKAGSQAGAFARTQFVSVVRSADGQTSLRTTLATPLDSYARDSQFTPDKKRLGVLFGSGQFGIFNRQGQMLKSNNIGYGASHFQFFGDGNKVVTVGNQLVATSFMSGQLYSFETPNGLLAVRVLAGEKKFETIASDGTLMLHDTDTGYWSEKRFIAVPNLTAAEFSPDGTLLVTGNSNGEVVVWKMDWENTG